jgi:hypothetical protein
MTGDPRDSVALPLAIKVQPQTSDGQLACPFLVHFPTGFVPGKGVLWKVSYFSVTVNNAALPDGRSKAVLVYFQQTSPKGTMCRSDPFATCFVCDLRKFNKQI